MNTEIRLKQKVTGPCQKWLTDIFDTGVYGKDEEGNVQQVRVVLVVDVFARYPIGYAIVAKKDDSKEPLKEPIYAEMDNVKSPLKDAVDNAIARTYLLFGERMLPMQLNEYIYDEHFDVMRMGRYGTLSATPERAVETEKVAKKIIDLIKTANNYVPIDNEDTTVFKKYIGDRIGAWSYAAAKMQVEWAIGQYQNERHEAYMCWKLHVVE